MGLTDINYNSLLRWLTPLRLRRSRLMSLQVVAWLQVRRNYDLFKEKESENWYEIKHTPAIAHMEGVLNDRFDNIQRRIWIGDGEIVEPDYIYIIPEELPLYLYTEAENQPQYLYTEIETLTGITDFIVWVPQGMLFDINEMKALVNKYRLAGKSYAIQFFE